MYFIITKKDNVFEKMALPNTASWEELVSKINGTVIEIFQNDLLEAKSFEEYFNVTYRKTKVKNARPARRHNHL